MMLSARSLSSIGVVGAGNMGSSIAVAATVLGVPVYLVDTSDGALQAGLARIEKMFASLAKKSRSAQTAESGSLENVEPDLPETLSTRRALIKPVETLQHMRDVDLIIEAVYEDIEVKRSVFNQLDAICKSDAIFASNTSSFSITRLASFTQRSHQVIGLHFFNPAHVMKLVEVIPGLNTAPEIVNISLDLVRKLGKLPIQVSDCASFLVNRLLSRYINEAIWVLQDGLADVKTIDQAACDLLMPIGPLQLRDMNGLDIGLAVAKVNYEEYGERFKPPPLLEKMVVLNMLGRKTKSGFYSHDQDSRALAEVNPDLPKLLAECRRGQNTSSKNQLPAFDPLQLFLPMINEAFLALQEKIIAPEDMDLALQTGLGMRQGLLQFAFDLGLERCLGKIEQLCQVYGERFRPAPLLKRCVWAGRKSLC